jgi:hypothetical protein
MPFAAVPLDGSERFTGLDATVADFWRWAFSDLRDNTTRGILAEFLVARVVGDKRDLRIGWDNFDAQAPDGTTIEVKCSAFLQSWALKRHSELRFGRLSAREFDATRNEYSVDARVRADVFVFCVQTQREPAAYDMLDISHWEFWVVDASTIRELGVKSIGIGWVRRHTTGPLPYGELAEAIRVAARANSAPRLTGTTAAAETKKRYQASLDEKLLSAGAEVMEVAERLRVLGDEVGLFTVSAANSLQLRDRLGAVVLLYPTYRTLEFPLEFLWRAGREAEIGEVRDALHQIAGKQVSTKLPNLGCREALAQWEAVVEVVGSLARIRTENMP